MADPVMADVIKRLEALEKLAHEHKSDKPPKKAE